MIVRKKYKVMTTKIFPLLLFSALFSIFTSTTNAQSPQQDTNEIMNSFRFYKDINIYSINTPTVVEIPLMNDPIRHFNFAVFDKTTGLLEPHFFKLETNEIPVSATANQITQNLEKIIDHNPVTYADFPLPENTQGQVLITLTSLSPITSSSLTILLDQNVSLPTSAEIRAIVNGQNTIIVANRIMNQQTINFPQTTSDTWQITLNYNQPLRISELQLRQKNSAITETRALRFLAQPNHSYQIYLDPDKPVNAPPVGEAGNLASAQNVLAIAAPSQKNPSYTISDTDGDAIPDVRDNCANIANFDQLDANNNGKGDICDDFDQDGLINSQDNCPDNPNRNQKDTDGDKMGDVCDKEESRITERYPWLPWIGIGSAAIVLIILFVLTARTNIEESQK